MIQKNFVAFVNADGSVNLFERVYDNITESTVWDHVPVDVIAEPKAMVSTMTVAAGLLALVAATVPFVKDTYRIQLNKQEDEALRRMLKP